MMISDLLLVVIALFPVSEIVLALTKRTRGSVVRREDAGSMRTLWLSILLGVTLAFFVQRIPAAHIAAPRQLVDILSLLLMLCGLALRWMAILTLGRLFTVDVSIQMDHEVVEHGLYRYIRHPSYSGLLLTFLGFGIWFSNWLSLLGMLVPIFLGVLNRTVREEKVLRESLGQAYETYSARTRRFIPWVL